MAGEQAMGDLRIGIADYEQMKAWTLRIARGEGRPSPDGPKLWFTSTESCANVMAKTGGDEPLSLVIKGYK